MGTNQTQSVLYQAAHEALAAPSIFNTQPWAWTVYADRLELRADRTRQLSTTDTDGRLLTISCGVALHHAMVAISGHRVTVSLLPDAADPDLFAVLSVAELAMPDQLREQLRLAISRRRSDRRPFAKTPIEGRVLDRLTNACTQQGAHFYLVPWHQMSTLALAAVAVGALQMSDPAYRVELADWTHRPPWSGDGVPTGTAVQRSPRRVPIREFAPFGGEVMAAGLDNDFGSTYGVVYTDGDAARDWLIAGMSLSALLLTATAAGLATAIISDVTEEVTIRQHIQAMLPSGRPQVAVRIGHPQPGLPPSTPRRPAEEGIRIADGT